MTSENIKKIANLLLFFSASSVPMGTVPSGYPKSISSSQLVQSVNVLKVQEKDISQIEFEVAAASQRKKNMCLAISKGDEYIYEQYYSSGSSVVILGEYFFFSLVMANRFNSKVACRHIFEDLTSSLYLTRSEMIDDLDEKTRSMAMYYLLKSYELGDTLSARYVDYIFGNNVPKSKDFVEKMI